RSRACPVRGNCGSRPGPIDLRVTRPRRTRGQRERLHSNILFDGELGRFKEAGLGRVAHPLGPDVEAAVQPDVDPATGRDLPAAPNAFALIEARVEDVVPSRVGLGPATASVREVVSPAEDKSADEVSALAAQVTGPKLQ